MEDHSIKICETVGTKDRVEIRREGFNELTLILPDEGFTVKVSAPLFNIQTMSPADITLLALASNRFLLLIVTPGATLETIVPSLVLEVFNPDGVRIIKIVAPPDLEQQDQ